jgi:hypothetical protein
MKKLFIIILLFNFCNLKSQTQQIALPLIKLPKIKQVKLVNKNDKYQFNTEKWQKVDSGDWLTYFAIENNKLWTGQQVAAVRVLGSWGLNEAAFAYLYVVDIVSNNDSIMPSVFISSYNTTTKQKGIDINPFKQAPAPTGMKGKINITETLSISKFGVCVLKSEHKSVKKTLSKLVTFSVNEDGSINKL